MDFGPVGEADLVSALKDEAVIKLSNFVALAIDL